MTEKEKEKILDEHYANIIVRHSRFDNVLNLVAKETINKIDEKFGVVYYPVSEIPDKLVKEYGYTIIPKIYGLLNSKHLMELGVKKVQAVPKLGLYGEGVILGFIDTGIDYLNPAFQYEDHSSRILSIWDQTIVNKEASQDIFYYGTEYHREQINEALHSENPYSIVPSKDNVGHGTILAAISGGSIDQKNDFQGVVPLAEFAVVKIKQAKKNVRDYFFIPDDTICYEQDDIMMGIKYLTNLSHKLKRPIVICIGLGTNQGGHDGNDILSEFINSLGDNVGTAFVIAGGNEGNSNKHFWGTIANNAGYKDVELHVGNNVKGFSMELWGVAPALYSLDIISSKGQHATQLIGLFDDFRKLDFIFDETIVYINHLSIESETGNPFILIRFVNPSAGTWKLRVYNKSQQTTTSFNVWLPMSNFLSEDTYFNNASSETTITSPANAYKVTTVTAYETNTKNIYLKASRGFTAAGNIKPDLAAPGVDVSVTMQDGKYVQVSGTSFAAAYVAGIAAMIFEWGMVKGNYSTINSKQMQRFLIRGAKRQPGLDYPNNIWGYGCANICKTFLSVSNCVDCGV